VVWTVGDVRHRRNQAATTAGRFFGEKIVGGVVPKRLYSWRNGRAGYLLWTSGVFPVVDIGGDVIDGSTTQSIARNDAVGTGRVNRQHAAGTDYRLLMTAPNGDLRPKVLPQQ